MSEELYLIAHVVRGSPAFDIARKIIIDGDEEWIIPTSGHLAHPYWFCEMWKLGYSNSVTTENLVPPPPPNHIDHYHASRKGVKPANSSSRPLLEVLGLNKPKIKIERRM